MALSFSEKMNGLSRFLGCVPASSTEHGFSADVDGYIGGVFRSLLGVFLTRRFRGCVRGGG